MYPELMELGGWSVRTYLVAEIVAFLLGSWWVLHRAAKLDISRSFVLWTLVVVVVCFPVGCRLYYILEHWADYAADPGLMFVPVRGGTGQYGGFLLAMVALAVLSRCRGVSLARLGSILLPAWFLVVAICRLGCLASGCCFGLPSDSFLGIHFPVGCRASLVGAWLVAEGNGAIVSGGLGQVAIGPALHPTQLYAVVGALVCLAVFFWLERRVENSRLVVGLSLALFGLSRVFVDYFRYYEEAGRVGGWPVSSWIGVGLVVFFSVWGIRGVGRRDTADG